MVIYDINSDGRDLCPLGKISLRILKKFWILDFVITTALCYAKHRWTRRLYLNLRISGESYYQNYFFIFSLIRSFIFFIKEIIIQSYVNKGLIYIDYFIKIKNNKELFSVFKILSSSLLFSYDQLINLSCVDNLNLKSYNLLNRFTLVYVLNKINTGSRLILLIDFCEKEIISSISSIYKAANWLEREVFDLFGIFFSNHFDLRRILTDYGFKGFPLRKDFPLTGYIELRYSEEKKYVKYKRLLLMQEYRFFNFLSPWEQYIKKVI